MCFGGRKKGGEKAFMLAMMTARRRMSFFFVCVSRRRTICLSFPVICEHFNRRCFSVVVVCCFVAMEMAPGFGKWFDDGWFELLMNIEIECLVRTNRLISSKKDELFDGCAVLWPSDKFSIHNFDFDISCLSTGFYLNKQMGQINTFY